MLVSTYKHWIKNIPFRSLKYGDHKNEDCLLTYPNINEKQMPSRRGVRVPYNSIQMPKNPAGSVIDRPKSTCRKRVHSYDFLQVNFRNVIYMNLSVYYI